MEKRVHRLGAGPTQIPQAELPVETLASALTDLTEDPDLHASPTSLGTALRTEDGVGTAIRSIAAWVAAPAPG